MLDPSPTPCIVVAIDGSQSAVDAALWAIDEAVERDVPLRLVYVIEPADPQAIDLRRIAEVAVRHALTAVESTERPVKLEVEILQGRPVQALLEAACSAVMLCVGARGLKHATQGRIGSTAAALSASAHCPVAIVRTHRAHSGPNRAVVIEVNDTPAGSAVLHRGFEAAQRRGAQVTVLTPAGMYADVQAHWQRRLAEWQRRYPDLDITSVSTQGDGLEYIAAHAGSIQLVVVGRDRPGGVGALLGPLGNTALRDTDCSILVCEPHNAL